MLKQLPRELPLEGPKSQPKPLNLNPRTIRNSGFKDSRSDLGWWCSEQAVSTDPGIKILKHVGMDVQIAQQITQLLLLLLLLRVLLPITVFVGVVKKVGIECSRTALGTKAVLADRNDCKCWTPPLKSKKCHRVNPDTLLSARATSTSASMTCNCPSSSLPALRVCRHG